MVGDGHVLSCICRTFTSTVPRYLFDAVVDVVRKMELTFVIVVIKGKHTAEASPLILKSQPLKCHETEAKFKFMTMRPKPPENSRSRGPTIQLENRDIHVKTFEIFRRF